MDLILDGIKLMVLGMGTVYLFLILMIGFMSIQAKLLKPFAGMLEAPAPAPKRKAASGGDAAMAEMAAAAVAAVRAKEEQ